MSGRDVFVSSAEIEVNLQLRMFAFCIYNSISNVYQQSNHSIMLDLGLFSACICTVTDHATTCLPISVDIDFWCISSHYNMQRFFLFQRQPTLYQAC